jgi:hypothetical protein
MGIRVAFFFDVGITHCACTIERGRPPAGVFVVAFLISGLLYLLAFALASTGIYRVLTSCMGIRVLFLTWHHLIVSFTDFGAFPLGALASTDIYRVVDFYGSGEAFSQFW